MINWRFGAEDTVESGIKRWRHDCFIEDVGVVGSVYEDQMGRISADAIGGGSSYFPLYEKKAAMKWVGTHAVSYMKYHQQPQLPIDIDNESVMITESEARAKLDIEESKKPTARKTKPKRGKDGKFKPTQKKPPEAKPGPYMITSQEGVKAEEVKPKGSKK